jgi:hypothetical protein
MKSFLFVLGLLLSVFAPSTQVANITPPLQEVPAYAKWGALALKETQQKYPDANVIDYFHIGSETIDDTTIEKFKLWLKDDRHEFGVFVYITFTTKTGDFLKIEFIETDR